MPKRSSKREDANQAAYRTLLEATGQRPKTPAVPPPPDTTGKNPAAVELGRLGGLKGGKARAAKLSKKARKAIATRAALARWNRKKPTVGLLEARERAIIGTAENKRGPYRKRAKDSD